MINKEGLKSNSKCCSEIIADARDKFLNRLSVKINDPNTLAKSYFSIINNFLNNKKIPATRQITAQTLLTLKKKIFISLLKT